MQTPRLPKPVPRHAGGAERGRTQAGDIPHARPGVGQGFSLLGAGPRAAARPNVRRCALGTPALGAAPLRLPGAGRRDCQRACGARNFAAFPRPLCSPSKWRGPRDGRAGILPACSPPPCAPPLAG